MPNPTTRNLLQPGLISIAALGLIILAILMSPSQALGQDSGNSTSSASDTATSSSPGVGTTTPADSQTELELVVICEEEEGKSELTCREVMRPPEGPIEEEDFTPATSSDRIAQGQLSGQSASESLSVDHNKTRFGIGGQDAFEITASNLRRDRTYQFILSRPTGDSDIAFNSICKAATETYSTFTGVTSKSQWSRIYGCGAGGARITATLLSNNTTVASISWHVAIITTPPTPTGLKATSQSDTSISVNWKAISGVSGYHLQYRASGSRNWITVSGSIPNGSKVVTRLTCGRTYEFQVRALGDGVSYTTGWSSWSSQASGVPKCNPAPNPPTQLSDVSTPTGINAIAQSDSSIRVTWNAVSNAHRYKLERRFSNSSSWTVVSSDISGTSYTVSGLDCDTTYYFRVSARGDGTSYSSNFSDASTTDHAFTEDCQSATPNTPTTTPTRQNTAPKFGETSYTASVDEDENTGRLITTVSASGSPTYSIVGGNEADKFSIGSSSGEINIRRSLDYEISNRYELTIRAENPRDSSKFDLAEVSISVTDVNESVVFDLDTYEFAIPRSSSQATDPVLVGAIRAADPDFDDIVTYSIRSGNSASVFSIDGVGRVWAAPRSLPTRDQNYTLSVSASDGNGNTDTSVVKVKFTSLPIVRMNLDHDRLSEGDSLVGSLDYSGGSSLGLQLSVTTPSVGGSSGGSIAGSSSSIRSSAFTTVNLSNGRGYRFSLAGSEDPTTFRVSSGELPSSAKVGSSLLTLSKHGSANPNFLISNSQIPIQIYDDTISVSDSGSVIVGEWGIVPTNSRSSEPNERLITLTVPRSVNGRNVQIGLTSGGRDPVLVLKDSRGSVIEWNDDGGAGLNSKIVRKLDSGTYTVVAYTKFGGGGGKYELRVAYSKEPLTDPDDELGETEDISLATPSRTAYSSDVNVTGITWKNANCSSTLTSGTRQGSVVCLEANGTGFRSTDVLVAVLYVETPHQPFPVQTTAVVLKYVDSTTMRGKWVAQWLSRYEDSGSDTTQYKVAILGNETFRPAATLQVGVPSASISGAGSSGDPVAIFTRMLQEIGYSASEISDIRSTLWLLYGDTYSNEADFLLEFTQGALLGEWGIRNGPGSYGIAYYAGWLIVGFIPGVDIPADIRDALALDTLKCSQWDAKCLSVGALTDLVDVVAIIPVVGKIGDVAQVARIVKRYADTGAPGRYLKVLRASPDIAKNMVKGKRYGCWALPPFDRGNCIQDELFKKFGSGWADLDKVVGKGKMPVVDFFKKGNPGEVSSVKSIEIRDDTYLKNGGVRIWYKIRADYNKLKNHSETTLKTHLREREQQVPDLPAVDRRLDVVIHDNVSVTSDQGRQLKRAACSAVTGALEGGHMIMIWYGTGIGTFQMWSGGTGLTQDHCRQYLRGF